jgi:hypothetical protein
MGVYLRPVIIHSIKIFSFYKGQNGIHTVVRHLQIIMTPKYLSLSVEGIGFKEQNKKPGCYQ